MKKQTAVEWYDQQLHILDLRLKSGSITISEYFTLKAELYNQAKAMEKEQIVEACKHGYGSTAIFRNELSKQYYNETFKSE